MNSGITDNRVLIKFGSHLRNTRHKKNMTLEDLSAFSGIDPSDISKIERGEINLTFTTLQKLAIGLEVTLKHLVDY